MSKVPKTLVILSPGFAKDENDSTCIPTQQHLISAFKKLAPELHIIVLAFQYPYFKKEYKWFDADVIAFDGRNRGGIAKLLLRKKIIAALKKIDQSESLIGILSFWYGECAAVGKKFASKHNVRHYCWLWGQDAKKENRYPSKIRMEAEELIALSDFLQFEFERNHGIKPKQVIPPGIDPTLFKSPSPVKDIDLLAAGSLIPLKRFELFVEIVAAISKIVPAVKAGIVGGGPEKDHLQSIINKKELQSNITLYGEMSHSDTIQLMQRSKIFLHTASYEGFGIVCIEALYAGCDVISFVRPMQQEIKNWSFVNTKEEMAQRTLQLLQEGKMNFESVMPFHIEQTVASIHKLFE